MDCNALERKLVGLISREALWEHVVNLSRFDRRSGSEGETKSVRYIEERLSNWGVTCVTHRYPAYLSYPLQADMEIIRPTKERVECNTLAFADSTPAGGLVGELCPVHGDIAGKIALIGEALAPEHVLSAEARGAIAVIGVTSDSVLHEMIVSGSWGAPGPDSVSLIPSIPAVTVTCHGGQRLRDLMADGEPPVVRIVSKTHVGWTDLDLPVATVEGSNTDQFLLVSGHLDSWFFGATDNATGNALLLELARILGEARGLLGRSVEIAWWTGHSTGRYAGSTWYADAMFARLDSSCVANINIDSPGVLGAGHYELNNMAEIDGLIKSAVSDHGHLPSFNLPPTKCADQSFWGIGIPAAAIYTELPSDSPERGDAGGSGGGWWWHNPADLPDRVDIEQLYTDTVVHASAVARTCNGQVLAFRFVPLAAQVRSLLEKLAQKCPANRFDLADSLEGVNAFASAVQELDRVAGDCPVHRVADVNAALMKVSRIINPVLYTLNGRFKQDPAVPTPLLPGLQPAESLASIEDKNLRGFTVAALVREQNRLVTALREATTIARSVTG